MNRDSCIHEKINQAVRLLCDVYEILNTKEEKTHDHDENKLYTIADFSHKHPSFGQSKIRWYLLQNTNNFKEKVTRKIGSRIYINEHLFFQWINEN